MFKSIIEHIEKFENGFKLIWEEEMYIPLAIVATVLIFKSFPDEYLKIDTKPQKGLETNKRLCHQ